MKIKITNNKKTIISVLLTIFVVLITISSITFSVALPSFGENHDNGSCHPNPGTVITITTDTPLNLEGNFSSTSFSIDITATGSNLSVVILNNSKDNDLFTIEPTQIILDGDVNDNDNTVNDEITVTFNVTAPASEGNYELLIVARNDKERPDVDFITFTITIGSPPKPFVLPFAFIFDHFEMYLGLTALFLLTLGTILVLINENKFVKVHGILAGASLILTLINVGLLVTFPIAGWIAFPPLIHWIHMILGGIGIVAGFFSMLFGIAAERKYAKLTGYITLICWWSTFFLGISFLV